MNSKTPPSNDAHAPGHTVGNRKGLDDAHASGTEHPPPESSPESPDQEAMDQADEAGSALLEHDKVLKQPKP